ncbi:MFS transporter [Peribacillus asahii]|uniref:MFS transporter n=1 Tax=Peribacillus asahii TaxID=228899 RepID=UPI00381FFF68
MNGNKLWTKEFISVSVANLLVFTTFYYLLVTLPVYALQDLHGSEATAGLITTTFVIAAIIVRPFAGKWIEKAGKSNVFRSALFILFVASFFYFVPNSITTLLILRFFHGIGFGMVTTATGAIVADLIPESRRGEGMGYYGLTLNFGMILGPFLGLTVLHYGGSNVMFVINIVCAFLALVAGLTVRIPKTTSEKVSREKHNSMKGIKSLLEVAAIPISLVAAFFALAYSTVVSFVSVYAEEVGLAEVASYFFVVYAIILLISRPFSGKWFDSYGANVIIYPAIVCFAIGMYLLSLSTSTFVFLLSAALIGLGWGTIFPSLQTIAIQVAPAKKSALATATFLSLFDFGFAVGSFVLGFAAAGIGYDSLYFYSSFLVIIGIGFYHLLYGRFSSHVKNNNKSLEAP